MLFFCLFWILYSFQNFILKFFFTSVFAHHPFGYLLFTIDYDWGRVTFGAHCLAVGTSTRESTSTGTVTSTSTVCSLVSVSNGASWVFPRMGTNLYMSTGTNTSED